MSSSKNKTTLGRIWHWTKKIFLILFIAQLVYIVLLKWFYPPITMTQFISWVNGNGMNRDYVSRVNISPNAVLAVMASEDQLFPDHSGFDWKSIKKAMRYNEKKPGRSRGASTISQQVAKNVFLWQGKSWVRKGLEMYFTFMIEKIWGKKRIMEVYLNVIEMGKGVFGIEVASRTYFNKPARSLSRQEAAMIAACLPNPKRYTVKPVHRWVAYKYPRVLRQMSFLEPDPDIQRILANFKPKPKRKT